jgi:hypothetical protein
MAAAAAAGSTCKRRVDNRVEQTVSDHDSKRIIRQWNREIEDENRREAARDTAGGGGWKALSWAAVWLLWLAVLIAIVGQIKGLR